MGCPLWTGQVLTKSKASWFPRKRKPSFRSDWRPVLLVLMRHPQKQSNTDNETFYRLARPMGKKRKGHLVSPGFPIS